MSKRKVDASLANVDASKPSPTKKKKKGTNSDFNGWWKLDLETSDTMEKYLGESEQPDSVRRQ